MSTPKKPKSYVGIDVSGKCLDVHVLPADKGFQVAYDEQGIDRLTRRLKKYDLKLIVLEATGGLEYRVAAALVEKGWAVAVVNPRLPRDFARSKNILAKTDAIDAKVLAMFAEANKPEARPLPTEDLRRLRELTARRRQLVQIRATEKNHLKRVSAPLVQRSCEEHIAWLDEQLRDLETQLRALIEANATWRDRDQLLKSVPGVGDQVSAALIAGLPELGRLGPRKIASLAGLAPFNCESGGYKGRRAIRGGRAPVRKALYMAVISGIRSNPVIKAMYMRLRVEGKPVKVAITATMRKLLTILDAMVKNNEPWRYSEPANA